MPATASAVQSLLGLAVIIVTRFAGWDPMNQLFFWGGTTGGFGILLLATATSVAVLVFFARSPRGEKLWSRQLAPLVAAIVLAVMTWLCLSHYSTLLGVPAGSPSARWLPGSYAIAAAVGIAWALVLKWHRRSVYEVIGLGPAAAMARAAIRSSSSTPASAASAAEETTR